MRLIAMRTSIDESSLPSRDRRKADADPMPTPAGAESGIGAEAGRTSTGERKQWRDNFAQPQSSTTLLVQLLTERSHKAPVSIKIPKLFPCCL